MTDYLKIPEVARRLDVSEPTVRRMVKGGKLPSVFIGGAYRISEEDLEKYLEAAKVQPGGGPGKAQTPPPLELGSSSAGGGPLHISFLLDQIRAAGSGAQEVAHVWLDELERSRGQGSPLPKYRIQEMYSFHNELSRLYFRSIDAIQKGAEQGITGVIRDGAEQAISPDPSLWPQELRRFVYEAGARIAALPKLIEKIEAEAPGQRREPTEQALYEEFNVEDHLPAEVLQEPEWSEELNKALVEVGA